MHVYIPYIHVLSQFFIILLYENARGRTQVFGNLNIKVYRWLFIGAQGEPRLSALLPALNIQLCDNAAIHHTDKCLDSCIKSTLDIVSFREEVTTVTGVD